MTTFGLPCAWSLAKTIKEGKSICLSEIHTHWKRISFDDVDVIKEGRPDLYLLPEWDVIQMKEQFRQLANPETTSMCPPPNKVNVKGAKKWPRYSQEERSTKCSPSFFEHMDSLHPDTPVSP
ncbi:otubain [Trifolium medium]|uniref:Otubain n=1 Tax=Trifolium medium TaxID=97028 RepID=A0A392N203_9FABA|nr:otubain [Trifolium medium]